MQPVVKSPVYRRYTQIRQECYNKNNHSYANVGGRGIKCYWQNAREFDRYVLTNLGPPPNGYWSKLTRIDTDQDWAPGNIEWSTSQGVAIRHYARIYLKIGRKEKTLPEWLLDYPHIKWATAYSRFLNGWSAKEILEIIPRKKK